MNKFAFQNDEIYVMIHDFLEKDLDEDPKEDPKEDLAEALEQAPEDVDLGKDVLDVDRD